ncbi:MAG TPA: SHOCT domain-containing protein [Solirubrobacterales bacterium]
MIAAALLIADSNFDNHMGDWGAGWWILMALMMVVFWGLVIVGAVWLVRALVGERHGHAYRSPLEVLDHRLASGEISPEEYRRRRSVIQGKETGGSDGS